MYFVCGCLCLTVCAPSEKNSNLSASQTLQCVVFLTAIYGRISHAVLYCLSVGMSLMGMCCLYVRMSIVKLFKVYVCIMILCGWIESISWGGVIREKKGALCSYMYVHVHTCMFACVIEYPTHAYLGGLPT